MSSVELVQVAVDGWQIECCGQPPWVGGTVAWTLMLTEDEPASADEKPVTLEGEATPIEGIKTWQGSYPTVLRAGAITAYWVAPRPVRGFIRVRGLLAEEYHSSGDIPDDMPPTYGVVRRIRVLTRTYASEPDLGEQRPVPGEVSLRDVAVSPKWFARDPNMGQARRFWNETGLLVDLAVYQAPPGSLADSASRRREAATSEKPNSPPAMPPIPEGAQWYAYMPLDEHG